MISHTARRQANEHTQLLPETDLVGKNETGFRSPSTNSHSSVKKWLFGLTCFAATAVAALYSGRYLGIIDTDAIIIGGGPKLHVKKKKRIHKHRFQDLNATSRCDWVVNLFTKRYEGIPEEDLKVQYAVQSEDANVFYRATALIFWLDFAAGKWGRGRNFTFSDTGIIDARHPDGTPLDEKSLWTWTTGDQHLSNFGAWRNRHGDIVFGVNDFDEAAVYDFHIDVVRVAVSIVGHALTNGLKSREIRKALRAFTDTYITTCSSYVGNDKDLLYELTPKTTKGGLQKFLEKLEDKSHKKLLTKFTEVDDETGVRKFLKNNETSLEPVSEQVEEEIKAAFTSDRYGATMMKMGWHVREWDDDYFEILDIAARVGTGVGSYGVDRYYVLLKGEDELLDEDEDGAAVILDVKYEPTPAVASVLDEDDTAWYKVLFANEAQRAVQAQRRLTSYTDPFTGWVMLDDRAFVVRQRSPWKSSPDLDELTKAKDFVEFSEQVAVATATSHVRGTMSKSPAQFKHVIASALGSKENRNAWGQAIAHVAIVYREQVQLDFECFKEFVDLNYS